MTLLSLFSGIGAFEKALENLKIDYDLVGFSEIDKYATKSYCEIHNINPDLNLGDITKIDETKLPLNIDLLTYTQLYKQAGNSIVVNVLEILLKQIFKILDEEV